MPLLSLMITSPVLATNAATLAVSKTRIIRPAAALAVRRKSCICSSSRCVETVAAMNVTSNTMAVSEVKVFLAPLVVVVGGAVGGARRVSSLGEAEGEPSSGRPFADGGGDGDGDDGWPVRGSH